MYGGFLNYFKFMFSVFIVSEDAILTYKNLSILGCAKSHILIDVGC